jgi:hypothetical protein
MPFPSKIVGDVARPAGLHPVFLEHHGAFAGSRFVHGDHDVVLGAAVRVQPGVELSPVTGTAPVDVQRAHRTSLCGSAS